MKLLFLAAVFWLHSVQAYEYQEYEIEPVTDAVWNFTPMDIDGDGVNEVLFQENLNGLFSYDFSGDLTVDRELIVSFDCEIKTIAVKDIDEDGFEDITLVCYDEGEDLYYLKELYNLAGAEFQQVEAGSFSTPSGYIDPKIGLSDIDADGDFDATLLTNSLIGWVTNNEGSFVFNEIVVGFMGLHSDAGQFVDLDADGDLDLVASTCTLLSRWCTSHGTKIYYFDEINGEYAEETLLSRMYFENIQVADLNQDGSLEVVGNPFRRYGEMGDVEMIEFQQPPVEINYLGFEFTGLFSLIDVNHDQKIDLIELKEGNIHINSGQANFTTQSIGAEIKSLADFNGDGLIDVIVEKNHPVKNTPYLFLLTQSFQAYEYQEYEIEPVTDAVWNFTPIDIDGDGVNEVLFQEDLYSLLSYDFSGELTVDRELIVSFDCQIRTIAVKDIDEDGFEDITLVCYNNVEELYYLKELYNLAGAEFQQVEAGSFSTPSGYIDPKIGLSDIDADGDFDATFLTNSPLGWVTNNEGSFLFNEIVFGFVGLHSDAGQFVDLDADGDLDLVASTCILLSRFCSFRGTTIYYFDEINGEYAEETLLSQNHYENIQVADLNQDGLLEVIGNPFRRYGARGDVEMIEFEQPPVEINYLGFEFTGLFSLIDINHDQKIDLIELKEGNIHINSAQANFTTQFIGAEIKSLADYNGDGLIDMIVEKNHPVKNTPYLFLLTQEVLIFKNGFETIE